MPTTSSSERSATLRPARRDGLLARADARRPRPPGARARRRSACAHRTRARRHRAAGPRSRRTAPAATGIARVIGARPRPVVEERAPLARVKDLEIVDRAHRAWRRRRQATPADDPRSVAPSARRRDRRCTRARPGRRRRRRRARRSARTWRCRYRAESASREIRQVDGAVPAADKRGPPERAAIGSCPARDRSSPPADRTARIWCAIAPAIAWCARATTSRRLGFPTTARALAAC